MIFISPVGKIAKGHVLDVSVKPFERALKDHDPQLYVKWNPKKVKGHGCWEIRRKPLQKKPVSYAPWGNGFIILLDYRENGENHVLDCAYLNYDAIRKVKSIDTWDKNHWIHDIEYREKKKQEEIKKKAVEELKYNLKQHKTPMKDFMNMVANGVNPADVLLASEWVQKRS